jgi:protein SCO1/2
MRRMYPGRDQRHIRYSKLMEPVAERAHGRLASNPLSTVLASAAVVTLALALVVLLGRRKMADPGPASDLGQVPSFEMPDQRGRLVSDRSLRGQALVVDFFFASCTTSCPMLTARMASVEKAIETREHQLGRQLPAHLVSITLDPENDTPDVLRQYAARYGADADRWSFLSGRSADLDRVVVQGFKTTFHPADPPAGIATIMHGEWLVVVDAQGAIRGYYTASDPERIAGLVQEVLALVSGGS